MSRRKGPRGLTPEEEALWQQIAARTDPLHPNKKKSAPATGKPTASPKPQHPKARIAPFSVGEGADTRPAGHDLASPLASVLNEQPVRMDRKAHRKLTRGKLSPEARIDLHGMTLAAAHPALTRFVLDSHARGLRLVLVITGKGRTREDAGPIPVRPGVLRHQVPQWLASGALRPLVLQVTGAHPRHGGAGAYYVYLGRRK